MLQIKYFRTFFIPINISERASSEHLHTHTHRATPTHTHILELLVLLLLLHIIPLPLLKIYPFFLSHRIDTSHAMATLSPLWIPHRIIC